MFENRPLYYMAPMLNAPWIVLYGILSYNRVMQPHAIRLDSRSIADPFVNSRRHSRYVEGLSLHDYVPLYWATHTPMQYVVTLKTGRLREDDLVFFVFDSETVLSLPGVLTTDGNAASDETSFWKANGALPSIEWGIIETPNCFSKEYKRKKCAEVLVPHELPPVIINKVCVKSLNAKSKLLAELDRVAGIAKQNGISMRQIVPETAGSLYYPNGMIIRR
jgi:hypothetical protein